LKMDVYALLREYGLYDTGPLFEVVRRWVKKKLEVGEETVVTFNELYRRTKKELTVIGCNMSQYCTEYFHKRSHGEMDVILSVQISCSIPVCFRSVQYKSDVYVDGGIMENYAMEYAREVGYAQDEILGVTYRTRFKGREVTGILDYMWRLMELVYISLLHRKIVRTEDESLEIDVTQIPKYSLLTLLRRQVSPREHRTACRGMYMEGYRQAEAWFMRQSSKRTEDG
jgi:predicted acylesterase/phospholipase RssA